MIQSVNICPRPHHIIQNLLLTLFMLGYFGKIFPMDPLVLLYLLPNYHQTLHDCPLGQNLQKARNVLLTLPLKGKYDVIKQCLVWFKVEIRVILSLV